MVLLPSKWKNYDFSSIILQIEIQMIDDIESVLLGAFVIATARCQDDDIQLFFTSRKMVWPLQPLCSNDVPKHSSQE